MSHRARLTFDQAVVVADLVCEATGAHIRDYGALAAVAAVVNPHLAGVPVYRDAAAQAAAVRTTVLQLRPLSSANEVAAKVFVDVVAGLFSSAR